MSPAFTTAGTNDSKILLVPSFHPALDIINCDENRDKN
ncbi:hypothetical protein A3Q56_04152 [Intoshia linei]|uniref:Uncharacterized protein n=1 Tax=Intoshia linei TaxID=1819745 RepID=A0A177B1I9_9BILA|nr:hypothetical protein A3Q56_04152 [Intoshia linei]